MKDSVQALECEISNSVDAASVWKSQKTGLLTAAREQGSANIAL